MRGNRSCYKEEKSNYEDSPGYGSKSLKEHTAYEYGKETGDTALGGGLKPCINIGEF